MELKLTHKDLCADGKKKETYQLMPEDFPRHLQEISESHKVTYTSERGDILVLKDRLPE